MRRNSAQTVALVLLLLGLGLGLARLFGLRYASGDVYPRYSTLRSDPLGSRVLFEALRRIDGLDVRRNTEPLRLLWDDAGAALFVLGADPFLLEAEASGEDLELEALVRHGLRAVIALAPLSEEPAARGEERGGEGPVPREPRRVPLAERLGFRLAHHALPRDEDGRATAAAARRGGRSGAGPDLPETLPWHTTLCFSDLGPGWRVLYARASRPVLIERHLGRGSLVLSADTYVLSNEALGVDARAGLVSWLVGERRLVIFDETHLGIEERPGVATLMRRYRLHAFVAAALLLAVLFVWRASVPFVPSHEDPGVAEGEVVPGRDAAAGLVTLLRRGIPPRDVLRVCREEWSKAFQKRRPDLASDLEGRAEGAADPVEGYRRISRILQEKAMPHER